MWLKGKTLKRSKYRIQKTFQRAAFATWENASKAWARNKKKSTSKHQRKKKYGPWPSESRTSDDGVYIYKKK